MTHVIPLKLMPQRPLVLGTPTDGVADALVVVEVRDEEDDEDEDEDEDEDVAELVLLLLLELMRPELLLVLVLLELELLELLELETLGLELELAVPHCPYRGWQPVPQWAVVPPHHPAEEQHLSVPWLTHVMPLKLMPQRPLVLGGPTVGVAVGVVLVVVVGDDADVELEDRLDDVLEVAFAVPHCPYRG